MSVEGRDISPGLRKYYEKSLEAKLEALHARIARLNEFKSEMSEHDISAWKENIRLDKQEIAIYRHILGIDADEDSDSIEDAVEEES